MTATTRSFFFGSHKVGFLYDIAGVDIAYPPGGYEELGAIASIIWRYLYPIQVVNDCRTRQRLEVGT